MVNPIDVSITIDTEFSIGGAFAEPDRFEPIGREHVDCPADGVENGLPFLIDVLASSELRATFFVETMQTHWFGLAPMGEIARRIVKAGHDVQLHVHPVWRWFDDPDWKERLCRETPSDNCAILEEDALADMIAEGIETFSHWGIEPPVAFRTGGLNSSRSVYRAMRRNGILLGSNVSLGYAPPKDPVLQRASGTFEIEGVTEVPVVSYTAFAPSGRWRPRLLSITSTSFEEIRQLLEQAHKAQISPFVLITHPFEFVKSAPAGRPGVRSNRINRRRMERLAEYLSQNNDRFRATTFAEGAQGRWRSTDIPDPEIRAPLAHSAMRIVSNRLNDLVPAL